jgi:hypothetical protein
MSRGQGHGVEVEIDSIRSALAPTRALRQALDVLSGSLPVEAETPAIRDALCAIHEHILQAELKDLRRGVLARDYFIISPINPMNPPGPEDMEKVAAALRTLDDLGLIITL